MCATFPSHKANGPYVELSHPVEPIKGGFGADGGMLTGAFWWSNREYPQVALFPQSYRIKGDGGETLVSCMQCTTDVVRGSGMLQCAARPGEQRCGVVNNAG